MEEHSERLAIEKILRRYGLSGPLVKSTEINLFKVIEDLFGEIEHLKNPHHKGPGEMSAAYQKAHIRISDEAIRHLKVRVDQLERMLKLWLEWANETAIEHIPIYPPELKIATKILLEIERPLDGGQNE